MAAERAPATTLRERIRCSELEFARRYIPDAARVLELGGASGLQALVLHQWGNDVASVDISLPARPPYYPVQLYDGRHLPFPSASFDVVFSSNVLEHVDDLGSFLAEAVRVMRPSGIMVHIVPGATWRFWTNITHYFWFLLSVINRGRKPGDVDSAGNGTSQATAIDFAARRSRSARALRLLKNALIPQPHGVYPSALSELYYYSAFRWRRLFQQQGLEVTACDKAGVFYSGYKILPWLDVPARRVLARVLGSSCHIFVLRTSTRT
jgi:SAM-dependent methyltransferase